MTRQEQIDLDREVARVIFGEEWADDLIFKDQAGLNAWWCVGHHGERRPEPRVNDHLPRYSSDIRAAWRIVEKMREAGWGVMMNGPAAGEYLVQFWINGDVVSEEASKIADTAPLAICQAALKWAKRQAQ